MQKGWLVYSENHFHIFFTLYVYYSYRLNLNGEDIMKKYLWFLIEFLLSAIAATILVLGILFLVQYLFS